MISVPIASLLELRSSRPFRSPNASQPQRALTTRISVRIGQFEKSMGTRTLEGIYSPWCCIRYLRSTEYLHTYKGPHTHESRLHLPTFSPELLATGSTEGFAKWEAPPPPWSPVNAPSGFKRARQRAVVSLSQHSDRRSNPTRTTPGKITQRAPSVLVVVACVLLRAPC